jgi:hypothetical protein
MIDALLGREHTAYREIGPLNKLLSKIIDQSRRESLSGEDAGAVTVTAPDLNQGDADGATNSRTGATGNLQRRA